MNNERPTAAVIGGGPAGLMAAEVLARGGVAVTVYDRMPSVGRKLLMAGRGGLNLTHSEPLPQFLARYGGGGTQLREAVEAFPPQALRDWAEGLGEPTFVGSSGRVFPKAFKASPLLRAWLRRLSELGVVVKTRHRWTGWDKAGRLAFETPDGTVTTAPQVTILALGGGSWPKLGSDGGWTGILTQSGIAVEPLAAANCGVVTGWSDVFRRFEGQPLKRIAVTCDRRTARGEAMVTQDGLEGGAIYALSGTIRGALARNGAAVLTLDLLPDVSQDVLARKLAAPRGKQSFSNFLRKATHLSPAALGLLREDRPSPAALDASSLAGIIKAVQVRVTGLAAIAKAISTAGGVRFDALDDRLMVRTKPGVFVAGEMLDWESPTGGYLLQACFATAVTAANGALDFLRTG